MSYLLDTNIISEMARPRPAAVVSRWLDLVPSASLHLSVIALGEIRRGVELLPAGSKRERLRLWLETELPAWFEYRLIPVDAAIADRWGRLLAEVGRSVPAIDSLLAATALERGLRLVTRNEKDFRFPGLVVVNPWNKQSA